MVVGTRRNEFRLKGQALSKNGTAAIEAPSKHHPQHHGRAISSSSNLVGAGAGAGGARQYASHTGPKTSGSLKDSSTSRSKSKAKPHHPHHPHHSSGAAPQKPPPPGAGVKNLMLGPSGVAK